MLAHAKPLKRFSYLHYLCHSVIPPYKASLQAASRKMTVSSDVLLLQLSRKNGGLGMAQVIHEAFATTSERGLRHDILPMRLYHKAKRLGTWGPRSIDFSQDCLDWQRCTEEEKETL